MLSNCLPDNNCVYTYRLVLLSACQKSFFSVGPWLRKRQQPKVLKWLLNAHPYVGLRQPPKGSGNITEDEQQRMEEPKDREDFCEMLPTRYSMAMTLIKPEKLWLRAQDLHKIELIHNPDIDEGVAEEGPSQLRSYWQLAAV